MPSRSSTRRVQPSLLSPAEKPVLLWLAARMPPAISSDALTALGLLGAVIAFAGYLLARGDAAFLWLASLGLALNWFGDSLDGTLARHRKAERPRYGFFIDHVTDLFAQLLVGLGLALCGYMRPEAVGFVLVVYLMIVAATLIAESATGEMAQSVMLIGPTEMRLLLMGLNAWFFFFGPPLTFFSLGMPLSLPDLGAFAFGLMTLAALAWRAVRLARDLKKVDFTPSPEAVSSPAALPPAETISMLELHHIAGMNRTALEDACRQRVQSVYLGENRAMCRILGRYKFQVDTRDHGFAANVLMDGYWEIWLTQFIARTVKPGMVVADIGANFGYYTTLMAELVDHHGRVHSFEPNPAAAEMLERSVRLNVAGRHLFSHRMALGDSDGEDILFVPPNDPKNAYLASSRSQEEPEGRRETVPVRRLDSLFGPQDQLDFVKIDVEGAEEKVIAGMSNLIETRRPSIVLEFNAGRYRDAAGFLARVTAPYGALQHIDYSGCAAKIDAETVLTQNVGEDWLLYFDGSA